MQYKMKDHFEKSEDEYICFKKENRRCPTEKEWNKIAKEKELLSSVSMRYIGNTRFNKGIF